jgi:uncharacterized membrane protein (UPF0127 family)
MSGRLVVVNRTRDAQLGDRVRRADRFWSRARGFLGRRAPESGEGILLSPCDAVHMFGMTFPLDVVFLDDGGQVVRTVEDLRPWSLSGRVRDARHVLEVPVGTLRRTGTVEGDTVEWAPSESPKARSMA